MKGKEGGKEREKSHNDPFVSDVLPFVVRVDHLRGGVPKIWLCPSELKPPGL